jgi:hypothetical protein
MTVFYTNIYIFFGGGGEEWVNLEIVVKSDTKKVVFSNSPTARLFYMLYINIDLLGSIWIYTYIHLQIYIICTCSLKYFPLSGCFMDSPTKRRSKKRRRLKTSTEKKSKENTPNGTNIEWKKTPTEQKVEGRKC